MSSDRPRCFGQVQNVYGLLWTNFYNLDLYKMIWTRPKPFWIHKRTRHKKHFGGILKNGLQFPPDSPRFTPQTIPAKYGLKPGVFTLLAVELFASEFVHGFIDALNSHLTRAPGFREALVNYL